jgi:tetratricopeptide (TPR) repeat protein
MDMQESIVRIKQLKAESLDLRSKGDLAAAMDRLRSGVETGREAIAAKAGGPSSDPAGRLEWEVADCLGILGGMLLKEKRLREAIEAFREGHDLEMKDGYRLGLTYNSVNYLVALVMDSGWGRLEEFRSRLSEITGKLKERMAGAAASDLWAWADLGLCELLMGNLEAAKSAYTTAAALANAGERRSMLNRLALVKAKTGSNQPGAAACIDEIEKILAWTSEDKA